ncbi:ribosome small subunit-dependent GTPase A [Oricola indica]|uniref:ribosome small subunit-dependent GTPase A n=1 Tax=Oricola indica TaxID=2872591 RepID=UPI003CCBCEF7
MTINLSELADFGWKSFFTSQLETSDFDTFQPVRVTAVHRNALEITGLHAETTIPPFFAEDEEDRATVGDWLLIEPDTLRIDRILDRKSLFKRRAAGTGRHMQLIAANIDTLFIVTSCNQDFNVARLERYLALAQDAGVTPVIVLTKADLTDTPEDFERDAARLMPALCVETVDARDPASADRLTAWCGRGETIALVGSSGVGKSTLVNTLIGAQSIVTAGIREDDAKGRHTTTGRMLHRLPSGGWLLDTPGMRELQLTDVHAGIDDVFSDVAKLAQQCRFRDCGHDGEPGCAVEKAVAEGALDPDRVRRWKKLLAEDAHNSASLSERRARDKQFGKLVKRMMKDKKMKRGD